DYQGAADDLTKVISLDPRNGLAYSNRGLARAKLGDRDGAVADLRKALELDPEHRDKIQSAIDALTGAPAATVSGPSAPAASPATAPTAAATSAAPGARSSQADKPAPPERRTGQEESQYIQ
ncbi:MAG: tetratricopeptide repeat protein, partial [Elusimicrobia bacterium]|nr:tetratricopeptide repeat protein [Elusimicrobiota bacterium]